MTKKEIKEGNKLIAAFLGYKYYHKGVDIDESECGGIYTRKEIFSKVPILVDEYKKENQYYFSNLPNPDYKKKNPKKWSSDLEFLSWSTLNSENYITDLKYNLSWDELIPACKKWDKLNPISTPDYIKLCDLLDNLVSMYEINPVFSQLVKNIKWHNKNIINKP